MRPRRRRPPRAEANNPFQQFRLVPSFRTTNAAGGTIEISIAQSFDGTPPWVDPIGDFILDATDQGLKVRIKQGATTIEADIEEFSATSESTAEWTGTALLPPNVICSVIDDVLGNVPHFMPRLGCVVDTTQPNYATEFTG